MGAAALIRGNQSEEGTMNKEEMAQEIDRLTVISNKLADMLNEKIDENTKLKATEASLWYEIDYLNGVLVDNEIELDPGAFSDREAFYQQ